MFFNENVEEQGYSVLQSTFFQSMLACERHIEKNTISTTTRSYFLANFWNATGSLFINNRGNGLEW